MVGNEVFRFKIISLDCPFYQHYTSASLLGKIDHLVGPFLTRSCSILLRRGLGMVSGCAYYPFFGSRRGLLYFFVYGLWWLVRYFCAYMVGYINLSLVQHINQHVVTFRLLTHTCTGNTTSKWPLWNPFHGNVILCRNIFPYTLNFRGLYVLSKKRRREVNTLTLSILLSVVSCFVLEG